MNNESVIICLHRGNGWVSKLIKWQTRSEYSHVSIQFRNGMGVEAREGKGVRFADRWEDLLNGKEDVEKYTVPMTQEQAIAIESFAMEQVGKGYDWTMVARFVSRRQETRASTEKWYCSEIAYAAFQKAGINLLRDTQPWEVSPGLLGRSPLLIPLK